MLVFTRLGFVAVPGFAHNWLTRLQQGWSWASLVSFPCLTRKIAHRLSQGRVLVSASFLGMLWVWQGGQIPLQLVIYRLLDGTDGEFQGTIPHLTRLSADLCRFHIDEPFFFQLSNVLGNGVGAHASVLANASNAGPTLVRFPVLAENQVGIER